MKISIKKDNNNKILFDIDEQLNLPFEYNSFKILINKSTEDESEPVFDCEDELKEYKELIEDIIKKTRTDDFKNVLIKAKTNAKDVQEEI